MKPDQFFISRNTGLKLHYRTYMKSRHNRHVFLFHGLSEHCNKYSYQSLAKELVEKGCCVHGMDMQAHGHSQEFDIQYLGHWTELVDDAKQWIITVLKEYDESHNFQFVSQGTGGTIAMKLQVLLQDSTDVFGKVRLGGRLERSDSSVSPAAITNNLLLLASLLNPPLLAARREIQGTIHHVTHDNCPIGRPNLQVLHLLPPLLLQGLHGNEHIPLTEPSC